MNYKTKEAIQQIHASPRTADEERLASDLLAWREIAEKHNAELRELSMHTKCTCDEAFTARGRHEPNSLCHLDEGVKAALAAYEKAVQS